jgi:hypothetical protein
LKRPRCVAEDIDCRVEIEAGYDAANHAATSTMKQASDMPAMRSTQTLIPTSQRPSTDDAAK